MIIVKEFSAWMPTGLLNVLFKRAHTKDVCTLKLSRGAKQRPSFRLSSMPIVFHAWDFL